MPKIKKCKASFINSIPFLFIGISRADYRQMVKERLPINWTCSDCQQPNNEESMHVEEENANASSDTVHASFIRTCQITSFIFKIPYLVSSDALDTKGYVQYNYDAGTSLQWYKFTVVRVDFLWYELTLVLQVCNGTS